MYGFRKLFDQIGIDRTPGTLVGTSGVGIAIANDPLASSQGWPNPIFDVDGTRSKHQQRFGDRRNRLGSAREQHTPKLLGERSSARFAGCLHRAPTPLEE